MSVSAAILTVTTIPQYIKERWEDLRGILGFGDSDVDLLDCRVSVIAGGNVNYAFGLTITTSSSASSSSSSDHVQTKELFLKQAPEFVAIFGPDGFPLTSQRMQLEMDVYDEWKKLLEPGLATQYLPTIYYFDKSHMVVIMEFLDGYTLLDHVLVSDHLPSFAALEQIANSLGDFMGKMHAKTHSTVLDPERIEYLRQHYENRDMRDIQLQFVFSKCYHEATDEQREGLALTPDFMNQVELLKRQYDAQENAGGGLVLSHGDLHPGSVMVNTNNGLTKVIDPEFTVYGPPGLDVGSLLSGYCLAAIHQAFQNNTTAADDIVKHAQAVWDSYTKAFTASYQGSSTTVDSDNNALDILLRDIAVETVGFTVAEVCRTALEFAGGRKWLQFDDPRKKAAAKKAALLLVNNSMIARHENGIELLWNELKEACAMALESR